MTWTVLALLALLAWAFLLLFRGGFWRADQRLGPGLPDRQRWPDVVAVIPARDEAATIGATVASLLGQDYPGDVRVVVVDDGSSDGTAAAAGEDERLTVVAGRPLPEGWSGKLWAVHQGLERAAEVAPGARYVLLTDADIAHDPGNLRRLVDKAEWDGLDLVSLMVRLRCSSFWEKLLIPAFVFFFQKLYPFPWVNDPDHAAAGAAGGCMLVRRTALDRIGGVAAVKGALIDDCALARAIKEDGAVWLGLADDATQSLRAYDGLGGIWRMVTRTAFVQLDHSALTLAGTVLGMALIYLAAPAAVMAGAATLNLPALVLGALAWALMAHAYRPTQRLYARPPWEAFVLPVAAFLYTLMTLDSARRHWMGRGGAWKGRSYSGG